LAPRNIKMPRTGAPNLAVTKALRPNRFWRVLTLNLLAIPRRGA